MTEACAPQRTAAARAIRSQTEGAADSARNAVPADGSGKAGGGIASVGEQLEFERSLTARLQVSGC